MILIVSRPSDSASTLLARALRERGVRCELLDLADFPQHFSVTATITRERLSARFGSIDLAEVDAVYYRRPRTFEFPRGLSREGADFAMREARRGVGGLLLGVSGRGG